MLKKSYSKTKPDCKVTFTLPIEAANGGQEVRVLGDFNQWSWENGYRMNANKEAFATEVELEAGKEYQFRYLIDNHIWENDWNADAYVPASFGSFNSLLSLVEEKVATKVTAAKAAAPKAAAPKANSAKAATDKAAPAAKSEAKPAATKAAAPKAAAKTTGADELTKIEGVGPKIAELLKNAGIVTFADLSKAKTEKLKGILEAAGKRYQMHDPSTWAQQATLAAKADWAKLEKLQGELKGGKR